MFLCFFWDGNSAAFSRCVLKFNVKLQMEKTTLIKFAYRNIAIILIMLLYSFFTGEKFGEITFQKDYLVIIIYLYMLTMYFWIPVSIYYTYTERTKPYFLVLAINILVILLAIPICGIFPMCME